jgi:NitT/TauT family transport system permease protein
MTRPVSRSSIDRGLKTALTLVALVVVWEISCRLFHIPSFLIPSPSSVALRLYEKRELYVFHGAVTLYETALGFFLAVGFGLVAAAIIVMLPRLRDIVMPILLIAQIVPKVAVAPLLLIWFGYGLLPKVLIAFLVAFFPIVVNGASGLLSVQKELLDLGSSLEATHWQTFWKFRLPAAIPEILSGMKVAITLAVVGAVIGEFVGGSAGLGYLIMVANQDADTAFAFASIFLLSVLGLVLYLGVEVAEYALTPWNNAPEPRRVAGTA